MSKHKKSVMARLGTSRRARLGIMGGVLASAGVTAALTVGTANAANESAEVRPIVIDGTATPKEVNSIMIRGCEERTKAACTVNKGEGAPAYKCIKDLPHDGTTQTGMTQYFVNRGDEIAPYGVQIELYKTKDCFEGLVLSEPLGESVWDMDPSDTAPEWTIKLGTSVQPSSAPR
jgi:hypothetical protein